METPTPKTDLTTSQSINKGYAQPALSPAQTQAISPGGSQNVAACGDNVCGQGEYCCNESCGICAPLGGACTQQDCAPRR